MSIDSLLNQTPDNTSMLQSTKFTFVIPDLPFLRYFCQSVQMPAVSATELVQETPFLTLYRHAERLRYDPLTITAIIDEDLRIWEETYRWLEALTRPKSFEQYPRKGRQDDTQLYYDGFLTTSTNANNPNIRVKFLNVHPTGIGNIQFDTKVDADTILTADFTFRYDSFEIERL